MFSVLLFLFMLFILTFLWCCLKVASISDNEMINDLEVYKKGYKELKK